MSNILVDGTGKSYAGKIDANNQFHVFAINVSEVQDATTKGNSYNINTGNIALTSSNASAVLYFKNNEAPVNGVSDIVIDAIAVGLGDGGTRSEKAEITIVRNPTGGTIVSGASAVSINQNRNFGSSNTLSDSLAYKGAEGNTMTGGSNFALFYQTGTRGYYTVDMLLQRGSSMGVTIDTNTTSGTTNIYVALICHRRDGKNA